MNDLVYWRNVYVLYCSTCSSGHFDIQYTLSSAQFYTIFYCTKKVYRVNTLLPHKTIHYSKTLYSFPTHWKLTPSHKLSQTSKRKGAIDLRKRKVASKIEKVPIVLSTSKTMLVVKFLWGQGQQSFPPAIYLETCKDYCCSLGRLKCFHMHISPLIYG